MKKRIATGFVAVASSAALCVAMTGCTALTTATASSQNPVDQYMSQISQVSSGLNSDLDLFIAAASEGDVVQMRAAAEAAQKDLDAMQGLETTEAIKEVKEKYDAGCAAMKDALDQYVALYESGSAISEEALKSIQDRYQEGVDLLAAADKAAAELS